MQLDLLSHHELDCFWDIKGSGARLPGKLFLSPQMIRLVVTGKEEQVRELSSYDSERDGPLLGYALDGSQLSLVKSFSTYRPMHGLPGASPIRFATATIVANICVFGKHLEREDTPIQGELWLSFPALLDWFGIMYDYATRRDGISRIRSPFFDYPIEVLNAELPRAGSRMRSFHGVSVTGPSPHGQSANVRAFLHFDPDKCNSASLAVERAIRCAQLLCMFCGTYVAPNLIQFNDFAEEDRRPDPPTQIFVPLGEFAFSDPAHRVEVILPFEALKDRIAQIVDIWLDDDGGPPRDAVNLFILAFRQRRQGQYGREILRDLVVALEAIADWRKIKAPFIGAKQAKELRKILKSAVYSFFGNESDKANKVVERVSEFNRATLKDKLAGLAGLLPNEVAMHFDFMREPLLTRVVDTRHSLSHGGRNLDVLSDEESVAAIDQLQLLLMIFLLHAVGIDPQMALSSMLENWNFRRILERYREGREFGVAASS